MGCYAIDVAEDRLACYDTISRRILAQAKLDPETERDNPETAVQTTPASAAPDVVSAPAEDFGRVELVDSVDQITSIVTQVTKSIRNNRIVELANGQIWMENEPGKQRIEVDQQITITKRRWRYTMKLPEGPIVAVHRLN